MVAYAVVVRVMKVATAVDCCKSPKADHKVNNTDVAAIKMPMMSRRTL